VTATTSASEGSRERGPTSKSKTVALVFAGGPAPGANAVINACASAFSRAGWRVVGIRHGFADLLQLKPGEPLRENVHYIELAPWLLRGLRNRRGVVIGTSRSAPGGVVTTGPDLDDDEKCASLALVCRRIAELGAEALVTIGGDGTLRTAYLLHEYQRRRGAIGVRVVHVPKTIDNDYRGIDFTFGFFTAVDILAKELLDLRADAVATRTTFIVECQGRRAGWLAYGAAIAGEAHLVVAAEDVHGALLDDTGDRPALHVDGLVEHIASVIEQRNARGKPYAVVVLAEGLVDLLPDRLVADLASDESGIMCLGAFRFAPYVARRVDERLNRDGGDFRVRDVRLGYEARSAAPHAFDVVLGTQLGRAAFDVIDGTGKSGLMVTVKGQLERATMPMTDLIDTESLRPSTRFVPRDSDFRLLAHELGTQRRE